MKALSVIERPGRLITCGEKLLEIRRWSPDKLPLLNLAIVQNNRRLTIDNPVDINGCVVAIVDIYKVTEWTAEHAEAACSSWEEGWLAWQISNVRRVITPLPAPAERKIYSIHYKVNDIEIEKVRE